MAPGVENVHFYAPARLKRWCEGSFGPLSMTTFGRIELDSDRGEQRRDTTQHNCQRTHGSGNPSVARVQQR